MAEGQPAQNEQMAYHFSLNIRIFPSSELICNLSVLYVIIGIGLKYRLPGMKIIGYRYTPKLWQSVEHYCLKLLGELF